MVSPDPGIEVPQEELMFGVRDAANNDREFFIELVFGFRRRTECWCVNAYQVSQS